MIKIAVALSMIIHRFVRLVRQTVIHQRTLRHFAATVHVRAAASAAE